MRLSLTALGGWCSDSAMGRLLDKLKRGAPAYDVKVERDGFTLIGKPDHIDEFSDIVREAADQAGEEFVVFTTSDGHKGYSQMFVMPLDDMAGL
ncbi:MAG: hypothetical protein EON56_01215 [Alphaproteobacteria bacterium]|nr:MAG: hypothetical protein EON56_01215 [Alphaproteobacteria bacterium]